ncbi:MAG: GFA family protein [Marinicaulis sp.]|nr:GFA family protein [Marinicaulis sp.]NNE41458.1 GFA family protein [Marinicaulis sp.]NNL89197.1 GFA family protein [Marinicaulis sp.]
MAEKSGKCLCGAVNFSVTPKAQDDGMHVDACHCEMCRRTVGGPLMAVALEGAPKIEDENALGVYASSDWAERLFCKSCGSNLFYRLKDGSMHTVNAGALDDLSDAKLTVEIFIDKKPSYYSFAEKTKQMTGEEVFAAFGVS